MVERWVQIKDTRYYVSNYGNVKRIFNGKHRVLKQEKTKNGYMRVRICIDGIDKKWLVHRLVCMCFIYNKDSKPQVNHKNGIKNDNRLDNLEWATRSENIRHAIDNKLLIHKKGIPRDFAHKFKKGNAQRQRPCKVIINGETREFRNAKIGALELGFSVSWFSGVCSGRYKTKLFTAYYTDLKDKEIKMAWRLKHIPTGLYFKPSKHRSKSNLSKSGRIYHIKPSAAICQVEDSYQIADENYSWRGIRIPCKASDWIAEKLIDTHPEDLGE